MATKEELQNLATNVFVANGWIDSPEDVIEAKDYKLFHAFSDRLSLSNGIKKLKSDNFENYLFLMARDYLSLGYAAIYQQTWSKTSYDEMSMEEITILLDEIWQVGAFEYAIGPMGQVAKSSTQDICLMAQTFATKYIGEKQLKDAETITDYKKAFYNIGIALGYKFCGSHF